MAKEATSKRVARIAAIGMKNPEKLTKAQIRSVCASCVTQFEQEQERSRPETIYRRMSGIIAAARQIRSQANEVEFLAALMIVGTPKASRK